MFHSYGIPGTSTWYNTYYLVFVILNPRLPGAGIYDIISHLVHTRYGVWKNNNAPASIQASIVARGTSIFMPDRRCTRYYSYSLDVCSTYNACLVHSGRNLIARDSRQVADLLYSTTHTLSVIHTRHLVPGIIVQRQLVQAIRGRSNCRTAVHSFNACKI